MWGRGGLVEDFLAVVVPSVWVVTMMLSAVLPATTFVAVIATLSFSSSMPVIEVTVLFSFTWL